MTIDTITADLGKASTLLTSLSADVALAMSAYALLKRIWMQTNPGKTEADYQAYLQSASQANIDDTAALLEADGFVEDPPGTWTKRVA